MTTYIPKKYACNACGHFVIYNQLASTNNFSRTEELHDKKMSPEEVHCRACKNTEFTVSLASDEDYQKTQDPTYKLREMLIGQVKF